MKTDTVLFPEISAGGFTRIDGTLQFYCRVNALLKPEMRVLDLGAGRGLVAAHSSEFISRLVALKGKVCEVVGLDIDPAVFENPNIDRAVLFDGKQMPLDSESFDLVVCDHVLEHVNDPQLLATEIARVLKPGGWCCARTPHSFSLLALASRLVPNSRHAKLISVVQPDGPRESRDVFPTYYRMNTAVALRGLFPVKRWVHYTYTWSPEPGYHFGSRLFYVIAFAMQSIKRWAAGEVLLAFVQKQSIGRAGCSANHDGGRKD
jgi:SAM-dependent methyltransferase